MDQAKLELAANWMQAVVEEGRILQSGTTLELSDMGDDRCRLSFEIDGAERTIPMPADWVEGIADGDLALRRVVKSALLELAWK